MINVYNRWVCFKIGNFSVLLESVKIFYATSYPHFCQVNMDLIKKTHSLNFYSYPHNIPFKISSLTNLWYHYIHKWYINNNQ